MLHTLDLEMVARLSKPNEQKILLVVIDGLGGLRHPDFENMTELEYATSRGMLGNINSFVGLGQTVTGLIYPVARGIIPGSGAGHLGLFGYEPFQYVVKRGAFEAAGTPNVPTADIVARLNFSCIDKEGIIRDRRAGRLNYSSERGIDLANKLNTELILPNIQAKVIHTRDHRGILALTAEKASPPLDDSITDTDPGEDNTPLMHCKAVNTRNTAALATARLVEDISKQARKILAKEDDANMIILRGFSRTPKLPTFPEVFSLEPAAIALYPLYRGVARLVGMAVLDGCANDFEGQVDLLDRYFHRFNFFYLHYKKPDVKGEDKDFMGKVEALAEFDRLLPRIVGNDRFAVIAITGDHSTPAVLGRHSEHSVPLAVYARTMKGYDKTTAFTEGECISGTLGRLRGVELMPILMAKAGKFRKFGA